MGIVSGIINILVAFVLPLVVAAYLLYKQPRTALWMAAGAVAYAVFHFFAQQVLFFPLISSQSWYILLSRSEPLAQALLFGFVSALFEEIGRVVIMVFLYRSTRKERSLFKGIVFGVGFGGIETVLIGVSTIVSLFLLGGGGTLPFSAIFSGFESAAFFVAQIAFSVMVLYSIIDHRPWYSLTAFVSHTVFSVICELSKTGILPVWLISIVLLLLAIGFLFWCYMALLRKRMPGSEDIKQDPNEEEYFGSYDTEAGIPGPKEN